MPLFLRKEIFPGDYRQILSDSFIDWVSRLGGQVQQKAEEDGWLTRLYFPVCGRLPNDLVPKSPQF